MKYWILVFGLLFIGCGSSDESSTSQTFDSEVNVIVDRAIVTSDNQLVELKGSIDFNENNKYFQNAKLFSIKPNITSDANCLVDSFTITPNELENNTTSSFDLKFKKGCLLSDNYDIELNSIESAQYLDTEIKTISRNITFQDNIDLTNAEKIVDDTIINTTNIADYSIQTIVPNNLSVDSQDVITINILNKDGSLVNADNVKDIKISFGNNLITADKTEYNNVSSFSVNVQTSKYSGIDTMKVEAIIFNGSKDVTITQEFKLVVLSGPINSISINYLNSSYDAENGVFVDTYAIHAVDKYSNPANEGSKIYFSAINGKKVLGSNGTISYDSTTQSVNFNTGDVNLSNIPIKVEKYDMIAVYPTESRNDERYLGGYIIDDIKDNFNLSLSSNYKWYTIDKLNFIIGNERRYNKCDNSISLLDLSSTDNSYTVNAQGIAYVTVKYDPKLVGKTITLFANAYTDNRLGIAKKQILKGTGVTQPGTLTCQADENKDTECELTFSFKINNYNEPMQDTLLKGTFIVNDEQGSCSIVSESGVTDCNGQYTLKVSVEKNTTCDVYWNNAIDYEY